MHIYKWTHKASGKSYIGQSIQDPQRRIYEHTARGYYLHSAIRKYGVEAFTHDIIAWANDLDELNQLEVDLIAKYDTLAPNGYNLRHGGGNFTHHPDSIKRMSESQKQAHARGKQYGWKRKDGGNMLGKTQSQKQKDMMKEAAKIQVTCPHCGKEGQRAAMGRWHFNNCKEVT